jgi:hypothetical protein
MEASSMLALSDRRWARLHTHSGDVSWVPKWLRRLRKAPDNRELFDEGVYRLWSDENTWSAAFAAAPHLAAIARSACEPMRLEYVAALGLFAAYRDPPGTGDEYGSCPPDLEAGFREALQAGLVLASELLPLDWGERETLLLLSAVAAFKGLLGLSRAIEAGGV